MFYKFMARFDNRAFKELKSTPCMLPTKAKRNRLSSVA